MMMMTIIIIIIIVIIINSKLLPHSEKPAEVQIGPCLRRSRPHRSAHDIPYLREHNSTRKRECPRIMLPLRSQIWLHILGRG